MKTRQCQYALIYEQIVGRRDDEIKPAQIVGRRDDDIKPAQIVGRRDDEIKLEPSAIQMRANQAPAEATVLNHDSKCNHLWN